MREFPSSQPMVILHPHSRYISDCTRHGSRYDILFTSMVHPYNQDPGQQYFLLFKEWFLLASL